MSSSTSSLGDIASITEYETCKYRNCGDSYPIGEDGPDSAPYCTVECSRRADAAGIMGDIKHDPTFCANCFHTISEVEEPGRYLRSSESVTTRWYVNRPDRQYPVLMKSPDDPYAFFRNEIPDCAQPVRTPTKNTQSGPSDQLALSDPHPDTDYQTAMNNEDEGSICLCGAGHHTTTVRPISGVDTMMEHAKRLSDVLDTLHREEEHVPRHDPDVLLDEVRARKTDPKNHTPDQHVFLNAMAEALQFG